MLEILTTWDAACKLADVARVRMREYSRASARCVFSACVFLLHVSVFVCVCVSSVSVTVSVSMSVSVSLSSSSSAS